MAKKIHPYVGKRVQWKGSLGSAGLGEVTEAADTPDTKYTVKWDVPVLIPGGHGKTQDRWIGTTAQLKHNFKVL